MERFTAKIVTETVEELNNSILNNYISHIVTLSEKDFLLSFSFYKKKKLFVSFNHQCPLIGLVNNDINLTSSANKLREVLRKDIKDAKILNIKQINNDRIIDITLERTLDVIFKETKHLIMEFIPHKPNLIIADENYIIKFATHTSSLDSNRIILPGVKYEALSTNNFNNNLATGSLNDFQSTLTNTLMVSIENKNKEKYHLFYNNLKSKIKSLNKKIEVLNKEIDVAKSNLFLAEIANGLLCYSDNDEELKNYIDMNNIDYDDNLSVGANANKLFLRYKKYKRTIEMDNIQIDKTKALISEYENNLNLLPYMTDNELMQLQLNLNPHIAKKLKAKSYNAISYIKYKNIKIFYGKNAAQNNYITFKLADKNDIFMHIKDYHGSHILIKDSAPDNDVLLFASEICLLLADKSSGDILYTTIKNVKKGNQIGNVNLLNYQEITLHKVREETKNLLMLNSQEYRY